MLCGPQVQVDGSSVSLFVSNGSERDTKVGLRGVCQSRGQNHANAMPARAMPVPIQSPADRRTRLSSNMYGSFGHSSRLRSKPGEGRSGQTNILISLLASRRCSSTRCCRKLIRVRLVIVNCPALHAAAFCHETPSNVRQAHSQNNPEAC